MRVTYTATYVLLYKIRVEHVRLLSLKYCPVYYASKIYVQTFYNKTKIVTRDCKIMNAIAGALRSNGDLSNWYFFGVTLLCLFCATPYYYYYYYY